MTNREVLPPRRRGLALLATMFLVGVLAGAALDRWYVVRHNASATGAIDARRAAERRSSGRSGEIEIPYALARLDLTPPQEEQIRQIVARFRPITDSIWNTLRPRAQAVESQLFQQSLCVLTPEQLERWKAYQRQSEFPSAITAERLRLVTTGTCPKQIDASR
jgi:hypothetical protein